MGYLGKNYNDAPEKSLHEPSVRRHVEQLEVTEENINMQRSSQETSREI